MRWLTAWTLLFVSLPQAYAQIFEIAQPHYHVIALRVEFAPDTTRFTTGDGTFAGLSFPLDPKVDPLPHDVAYFQAHLDFLEHYVETASAGNTKISTVLLPEVVQMENPMATYSPIGENSESESELSKLVALVQDSWAEADRISTFNPGRLSEKNTAFILFHAGVGRDIELIGTTLDKTPQDLPSVFISSELLSDLGGDRLEFKGIPVNHTMIIPRTETRAGVNSITDEPFLIELSINGLLGASFMSYLGVPDLFNTDTGESAIGPFGIMDPLGIFAYGGLFPPLPSAWTRAALGWVSPREIHDPGTYDLMAGEVAKIGISKAEYFLLENRVRDPDGLGLTMQISNNGSIEFQTIPGVRGDFNRFNIEAFQGGVVTRVNSYDFALPGWDSDEQQYNGGILIWHIDERQFASTGNNDPNRRAVDVEEADGAQDIGFDGNVGAPFDFYFEGNPASVSLPSGRLITLYENRFGPDTTPGSKTNGGGDSFLVFENFSTSGQVMSFSFWKNTDGIVAESSTIPLDEIIGVGSSISTVGNYGVVFTGTEVLIPGIGRTNMSVRPAFSFESITGLDTEGGISPTLRRYTIKDQRLYLNESVPLPSSLSAQSPVISHEDAHYALFSDTERSEVIQISAGNTVNSYDISDRGFGLVATDAGIYVFGQSQAGPLDASPVWTYHLDSDAGAPVMGRDRTGLWGAISLSTDLIFLQPDGIVIRIPASTYFGEDHFSNALAIVDLNQDGILDIVTTVGSRVVAFSQGGALLPPFPIQINTTAVSTPLVYESNEKVIVVIVGIDGNIYALDLSQNGDMVSGFPLSAGYSLQAASHISSDSLTVITQSGILRSYTLKNNVRTLWSEQHGNGANTGFVALTSVPVEPTPLLSPTETYNWPNPIRDGSTFFRFMTSEASEIIVTIVDEAGSLIDSFSLTTSGGVPHEIYWHSDAASGVYYARVKATSISGITDSHLIKLAIIQ